MWLNIKVELSHLEDGVEALLVGDGEGLVQVGGKRLRNQTQKPFNLSIMMMMMILMMIMRIRIRTD